MLKKSPSDKKSHKKFSFFFHELQIITALSLEIFIWAEAHDSSLWNCITFSMSIPSRFYLTLFICSTKSMDFLTFFQNNSNRKTMHSLLQDLWFLCCNKSFENLMRSVWEGAPQKQTWRHVFINSYCKQIFDIPLVNNLFISYLF